jgi:hypothetical protein
VLASLALGLALGAANALAQEAFDPSLAGFAVRCQDRLLQYNVESVFLLPAEPVRLSLPNAAPDTAGEVRISAGSLRTLSPHEFLWHPPRKPGVYTAEILEPASGQRLTLQALVLVPYAQARSKKINGYRIGRYPREAWRGTVRYQAPRGWVEVTPALLDVRVSPHFQLGQFVCKQGGGFPQYLVLDGRLLRKLERLLAAVNDQGHACSTLTVMSGYRTPDYNRRLGNVAYSSHVWGWAADVYLDADHDGWMDDVNQDGRGNLKDAYWLFQLAERADREAGDPELAGGLGLYSTTAQHGPFVHLDVRGQSARWGLHRLRPSWAEKPLRFEQGGEVRHQ